MEHASSGVITQALVFLAATCVLIPALKKARLSTVMGFLVIGVAMGPVIASIDEKRSQLRSEIMAAGALDHEPTLGRRRVRDSLPGTMASPKA